MTNTAAWTNVSGVAVKLLIHLVKLHDGLNHGELVLSEREAGAAIGVSRNTAAVSFDDLQAHGCKAPAADLNAIIWKMVYVLMLTIANLVVPKSEFGAYNGRVPATYDRFANAFRSKLFARLALATDAG